MTNNQTSLLRAIRENAKRLLHDADMMYRLGSNGTARSLAILSVEECVKFLFYHAELLKKSPFDKLIYNHKARYRYATIFLFIAGSADVISMMPYIGRRHVDTSNVAWWGNYQKVIEYLAEDFDFTRKEILLRIIHDFENRSEKLVQEQREKYIDELDIERQRGFYVDYDKSSRKTLTPLSITRRSARKMIAHAQVAAAIIEQIAEKRRGVVDKHRRVASAAEYFRGQERKRRRVQRLSATMKQSLGSKGS